MDLEISLHILMRIQNDMAHYRVRVFPKHDDVLDYEKDNGEGSWPLLRSIPVPRHSNIDFDWYREHYFACRGLANFMESYLASQEPKQSEVPPQEENAIIFGGDVRKSNG